MSRLAGWLLCAVLLLAPPVQAQDQPRSLLDGERSLIFVQGTAEVRVPPERAVISIDIERRDKEAARAAGELRVVVERANQIVNDFGNGATLRSDDTFASPIWDWKARRVITHLVRQSLHVDLPAAHAAQLVPLLLEAGVGRVRGRLRGEGLARPSRRGAAHGGSCGAREGRSRCAGRASAEAGPGSPHRDRERGRTAFEPALCQFQQLGARIWRGRRARRARLPHLATSCSPPRSPWPSSSSVVTKQRPVAGEATLPSVRRGRGEHGGTGTRAACLRSSSAPFAASLQEPPRTVDARLDAVMR